MKASNISFRIAVIFAIMGVVIGLVMAASHNHAVMPAHAHLNLLGWVSLFLFGIFYKLHPAVDSTVLARAQVIMWAIGTVVLATGVALIYTGFAAGEALAGIGSITVLIALLVFVKIVFVETSQQPVTRQAGIAVSSGAIG